MKLYLAGPCTGYPELNYPAFHAAAAQLREAGHEVMSPPEFCADAGDLDWAGYMRICIPMVMTCEAVALLPGWAGSKGATAEAYNASLVGMPCRPFWLYLPQPGGVTS